MDYLVYVYKLDKRTCKWDRVQICAQNLYNELEKVVGVENGPRMSCGRSVIYRFHGHLIVSDRDSIEVCAVDESSLRLQDVHEESFWMMMDAVWRRCSDVALTLPFPIPPRGCESDSTLYVGNIKTGLVPWDMARDIFGEEPPVLERAIMAGGNEIIRGIDMHHNGGVYTMFIVVRSYGGRWRGAAIRRVGDALKVLHVSSGQSKYRAWPYCDVLCHIGIWASSTECKYLEDNDWIYAFSRNHLWCPRGLTREQILYPGVIDLINPRFLTTQ